MLRRHEEPKKRFRQTFPQSWFCLPVAHFWPMGHPPKGCWYNIILPFPLPAQADRKPPLAALAKKKIPPFRTSSTFEVLWPWTRVLGWGVGGVCSVCRLFPEVLSSTTFCINARGSLLSIVSGQKIILRRRSSKKKLNDAAVEKMLWTRTFSPNKSHTTLLRLVWWPSHCIIVIHCTLRFMAWFHRTGLSRGVRWNPTTLAAHALTARHILDAKDAKSASLESSNLSPGQRLQDLPEASLSQRRGQFGTPNIVCSIRRSRRGGPGWAFCMIDLVNRWPFPGWRVALQRSFSTILSYHFRSPSKFLFSPLWCHANIRNGECVPVRQTPTVLS